MDVTIASVWVGEKYGAEYPAILADMVRRNLSPAHTPHFVCITDRPGELPAGVHPLEPEPDMPGWWQKVALFKPGKLPPINRILYLDLDVAITGSLDELVERRGIIRDWHLPTYNSSVMVWDAHQHGDVWATFRPDVMMRLHGDQDWLTEVSGWHFLPEPWCVSFRSHAQFWPPSDAKVVCFHGEPKPHQIGSGWVPKVWRKNGARAISGKGGVNVSVEKLLENMRSAVARGLPIFTGQPFHDRQCCLVGGGPGLAGMADEIANRQENGAAVVSMNGSLRWLLDRGITPSSHVLLDARPENVEFARDVPHETAVFVASQCDPAVFDALADHPRVIIWHASIASLEQKGQIDAVAADDELVLLVGGGSTVGLRSMYLAYLSGFRKLHLYGFDSCYDDADHHAYAQPLNEGERVIEVMMAGKTYRCAPWMAAQAQQFNGQWRELSRSCRMIPHGPGLIPDICRILNANYAQERYERGVPPAVDLAITAAGMCKGRRLAIQAGAATGHVPLALSEHFDQVIAFEPDKANFEAARETINGARVMLMPAALGDAKRSVSLALPDGEEGNRGAYQTIPHGDVPMLTIDGLELPACDLIMLDVEGDEFLALLGAEQTIAAHKPVIVLEDKGLIRRHGHDPDAATRWLAERGYQPVQRAHRDVIFTPMETT